MKRETHRPMPGSRPGEVHARPDALPTRVKAVTYCGEQVETEELDLATFQPDATRVTWIDVQGLADVETLRAIGDLFGLHPLALEDVVNTPQRPKVEEFEEHLFVVLQMLARDSATGEASREQLSLCVGDGFLVTFQERAGDPFDLVRKRLENPRGRLRASGADYLAYALIDAVIDGYMPVLENFEENLELLEEELRTMTKDPVERIQQKKSDLRSLRRAVVPLREVTRALASGDWQQLTPETQTYLRDVHDHALEAVEQLDSCREIASGLMDAHLSTVSNEVNQTTRILTIIATIFMPLSFLAGLYGMNFDPSLPGNMPELGQPYAYVVVLLVMVALAVALYVFFRRRGWF